jgi:hypothetical protein
VPRVSSEKERECVCEREREREKFIDNRIERKRDREDGERGLSLSLSDDDTVKEDLSVPRRCDASSMF